MMLSWLVFSPLLWGQQSGDVPEKVQQEVEKHGMTVDQAKKEASRLGIDLSNPDQAAQRARELGVPEAKIQELLRAAETQPEAELQTMEETQPEEVTPEEETQTELEETTEEETDQEDLEEEETDEETEEKTPAGRLSLPYFGYNTFQNIPDSFKPSATGPVSDTYIIGYGDELRLVVWGATEFQYELQVDRQGRIYVPKVGQLTVANKSLEKCRAEIKNWLSRKYRGLVKDPPTIFMDLTLTRLRPIRVFVLGELARPGGYNVSSHATVFNVLYSVGGPLRRGSLRNIQLIRNGKVIETIDFYDYLLKGYGSNSILLQDNDHVFIPPRGKTVSIRGQVKRPAIYELKARESVADLIQFAGGLHPEAYTKRFQIERVIPFEEREDPSIARKIIDLNLDEVLSGQKDVALSDGDRVRIFSILDILENVVRISGAVYQPGSYELSDTLQTVRQLINDADGITGDAYLDKAELTRLNLDGTERLINLNLNQVFGNDPAHNITLQPEDRLRIYSIHELEFPNRVRISGEIRRPGSYPLVDSMTVYDLLFRGGGLKDSVFLERVYLERADLIRKDENGLTRQIIQFNLGEVLHKRDIAHKLLKPDDQIVIYPRDIKQVAARNVSIVGKVQNPGNRPWRSNMSLHDLVFSARGLQDPEYLEDVFLERADLFREIETGGKELRISFDLQAVLRGNGIADMPLEPNDVVRVYPATVEEFRDVYVTIKGEVKNPGQYRLRENMNLEDLLLVAGGFTRRAFIREVELNRFKPPMSDQISADNYQKMIVPLVEGSSVEDITFALDDTLKALKSARSTSLEHRDIIFVRRNPNYHDDEFVTVSGEVVFPGDYAVIKTGEKISELVKRAGGLTPEAYPEGARFFRMGQRVVVEMEQAIAGKRRYDVEIFPGDRIVIPPKPNTVQVRGNVNVTGLYKYQSRKNVFYYINRAGGLQDSTKEVLVTYPSGETQKVAKFLGFYISNPEVMDGSEIVATKKKPRKREDVDIKGIITETMAVMSSALTIIVLANRL